MSNIQTELHQARTQLSDHSETPELDAEILLAHALQKNRTYLYAHAKDPLDSTMQHVFQHLVQQRVKGVPIAYLTGIREFWSIPIHVTPATLIPRPETEQLVELTLAHLQHQPKASILDLGTGSGAIALALAHEKPQWHITASDRCSAALSIAQDNAKRLALHNIRFIHTDWFSDIPVQQFDVILSNPPYIEDQDPHLSQGDLRFEPIEALTSGPDGLRDIQQIIKHAQAFLKPQGLLLLEHGYQQADAVIELLHTHHYQSIRSWRDHQGHQRISGGRRE